MPVADICRKAGISQATYFNPRPLPDWPHVHKELKRRAVTLLLLWEEYRAEHTDGYGYSRFCDLHRDWRKTISPTMRQTHGLPRSYLSTSLATPCRSSMPRRERNGVLMSSSRCWEHLCGGGLVGRACRLDRANPRSTRRARSAFSISSHLPPSPYSNL